MERERKRKEEEERRRKQEEEERRMLVSPNSICVKDMFLFLLLHGD